MVNTTLRFTTPSQLESHPSQLGLESSVSQQTAAEILEITPRTLAKWRRDGTGPRFFRIGIRPRYRLIDLIEWQRSRLQRSTLEDNPSGRVLR